MFNASTVFFLYLSFALSCKILSKFSKLSAILKHRGKNFVMMTSIVHLSFNKGFTIMINVCLNLFINRLLLAELQRAKRASEAPRVRKIGNPSSRENLVMTSAYDHLLSHVGPMLSQKFLYREFISPDEHLSVTLPFLGTGESLRYHLAFALVTQLWVE